MNKKFITENKQLVREFLGNLIKAIVRKQADKLVKDLEKKSPENAKSIQKMRDITNDMRKTLKDLEKKDPELVKRLKQRYGQ